MVIAQNLAQSINLYMLSSYRADIEGSGGRGVGFRGVGVGVAKHVEGGAGQKCVESFM